MKYHKSTQAIKLAALAGVLSFTVTAAHAQSTEEVVGAVVGGTAGAIVGGEVDKKGSKVEGQIIGGLVGGTLGYVIGGTLDNDRDLRRRYDNEPGEYYSYKGEPYRRYRNDKYGYVSFPVRENDPYYRSDGRKKDHPVFAEHPGRGQGKGLKKKHKKHKKHE